MSRCIAMIAAEAMHNYEVDSHNHFITKFDIKLIEKSLSELLVEHDNENHNYNKETTLPLLVYHITATKHQDDSDFMPEGTTLRDIYLKVAFHSRKLDEAFKINNITHSKSFSAVDSTARTFRSSHQNLLDIQHPTYRTKSPLRATDTNGALIDDVMDLNHETIHQTVNELRLRDIRRLDYNFNPAAEPTIIVRRHVILMSFDPIVRALIMADRLYVFFEGGADSVIATLKSFMDDWKFSTMDHNSEYFQTPFEIHAIDGLLYTVKSMQSLTFENISRNKASCMVFTHPGAILPIEEQEKMRNIKNDVNVMKSIVLGHKRALLELIDVDEVLALMNLSKLRENPRLYQSPLLTQHQHVEELLESYLMDYSALETKLEILRVNLQSAEEMILLRLDTSRNELLIANTSMAVLGCCIGFGTYISGIFGMNLDNFKIIQPINGLFVIVTLVTVGVMLIAFSTIFHHYSATGVFPEKLSSVKKKLH